MQSWINDETLTLIIKRASKRRTKDTLRIAAKSISDDRVVLVSPLIDAITYEIRDMSKAIKIGAGADKQKYIISVAAEASRAND